MMARLDFIHASGCLDGLSKQFIKKFANAQKLIPCRFHKVFVCFRVRKLPYDATFWLYQLQFREPHIILVNGIESQSLPCVVRLDVVRTGCSPNEFPFLSQSNQFSNGIYPFVLFICHNYISQSKSFW